MEEQDVPAFFQVSSCDGNMANELIVCVQSELIVCTTEGLFNKG